MPLQPPAGYSEWSTCEGNWGSSLPPGTGAVASSVVRDGNHPLTHYWGAPTRGGVEYTTPSGASAGYPGQGPGPQKRAAFTRNTEEVPST